MTRVVERVARALAALEAREPLWHHYEGQARAAIEVAQAEVNAILKSYLSPEFSIPECIIARMISDDLNAALGKDEGK